MLDDFELRFKQGYRLTTLQLIYYLPDYSSLVQEFIYQTLDLRPKYPRIHLFLDYWKSNIDAVIKDIYIASEDDIVPKRYNKIDVYFNLH